MFIPLKMVCIGIDPYPYIYIIGLSWFLWIYIVPKNPIHPSWLSYEHLPFEMYPPVGRPISCSSWLYPMKTPNFTHIQSHEPTGLSAFYHHFLTISPSQRWCTCAVSWPWRVSGKFEGNDSMDNIIIYIYYTHRNIGGWLVGVYSLNMCSFNWFFFPLKQF